MTNDEIVSEFDSVKDDCLTIQLESIDLIQDGLKVRLIGYIDAFNASFFLDRVGRVIAKGFNNLVLNCEGLTSISSSGVGMLVLLLKRLKARNGNIILWGTRPMVYDVFDLLGFSGYFDFRENLESAVESHCMENVCLDDDDIYDVFPIIFRCPVCSRRKKAIKEGRFRCGDCKTILAVHEDGQVTH